MTACSPLSVVLRVSVPCTLRSTNPGEPDHVPEAKTLTERHRMRVAASRSKPSSSPTAGA